MKIVQGEVFAIKTKNGYGFLQYVETSNDKIELIRVLEPIKEQNEITQEEVNVKERYVVQFVVRAALRRRLIEKTGLFVIPSHFRTPAKARSEHNIRGQFLGWHIVDRKTLKRELKQALNDEELKLSPHGISNDTF